MLCVYNMEIKNQTIINRLVSKSRHVLQQLYTRHVLLLIKLCTNLKLLFKATI